METQRGPEDRAPSIDEKVEGDIHEEGAPAAGTAPIGNDDQVEGQTQHSAPDDDVGVPPDEELGDSEQ